MRYAMRVILLIALSCVGCAAKSVPGKTTPEIQAIIDDSAEQQGFRKEHPDAASAVGTWSLDSSSQVLTLTNRLSDLGCSGQPPATISLLVVSVTDSTLTTRDVSNASDTEVVWHRRGTGSGLSGHWSAIDDGKTFLLSLLPGEEFILSIDRKDPNACTGGTTQGPGYFANGCWVDALAVASIVADGLLTDWAGVAPITDPASDSAASATGDDIIALSVAGSATDIAWRITFSEPIAGGVQPSGSYNIGYSTQNRLGSFRVRYEPGLGQFAVFDLSGATVAASATDLEVVAPWSSIGGKSALVQTQVRTTSDTPGAEPLDEGPCFVEF